VDKRGLLVRVNEPPALQRIRFNQLAEHYLRADVGGRRAASQIRKHGPKPQPSRPRLSGAQVRA
jgi:hypothetical protein